MTPFRSPSFLSIGLVLALVPGALGAQSADLLLFAPATELRAEAPPPLRLAERPGAVPLTELRAAVEAAPEQLAAIAAWNRAGRLPARHGFTRPLEASRRAGFGPELLPRAGGGAHAGGLLERPAGGGLVWGAEVRVAGAHRLRLHLSEVSLPPGAELWVYGERGSVGPFGLELRGPEGDLWTPSVGGPAIRLEVRLPAEPSGAGFVLDRVLESFPLDAGGSPLTGLSLAPRGADCLVDAQCVGAGTFDVIDLAQRAIALIEFIDGGLGFLCSGGLLNDLDASSFVPLFLTANHCFDNQAAASTVEAFWDFYSDSCDGAVPDQLSLPRSNGSTLLATGALDAGASDYTLVRLASVPANRVFLGWDADPDAAALGTILHRVSHPLGQHQHYSRNHVDESGPICSEAPPPTFLYQKFNPGMGDMGGTFGGSSGAPSIVAGGQVVGQLTGACGPDDTNEDGCNYVDNSDLDGAFAASFEALEPFLTGEGCLPGPTTLCLVGGRFQVEMTWRGNPPNDTTQSAQTITFDSDNSGLFYFLNPNNAEVLFKVINACSLTDTFWVFFAATTNVEYTLTVTDTESPGLPPKVYTNPLNQPAAPVQDTSAFATCP